MPGKPTMVAPSSEEELLALRRRCASALWGLVPRWVGRLFFGGGLVGRLWRTGPVAIPARPPGGRGADHQPADAAGAADAVGSADEDEAILAEIEEGILDVFGDAYCNKHLMYSALELILVRLMPELAEKKVTELWGERLS